MATGSGTQRERLTPLGRATSADAWREDPAGSALTGLACLLTMPACLGYELNVEAERAADEARRQSQALQESVAGAGAGAADALAGVIASATGPLEQASSIAMWGAIALYAVLGIIIALVVWWVFLR